MFGRILLLIFEFLTCLKAGLKARHIIIAMLSKFPKYCRLLFLSNSVKLKTCKYLIEKMGFKEDSAFNQDDLKTVYDFLVSLFLFKDFLPQNNWIIIDAGANLGTYTNACLQFVGKKGKIIAIEPDPQNFNILSEKFKNSSNVLVVEAALAENNEEAIFYTNPDYCTVSSLFYGHVQNFSKNSKTYNVKKITLDRLIEEKKEHSIDLLKIDIEGAEFLALLGGIESLKNGKVKRIIVEVHEDVISIKDIKNLLKKYSYKTKIVYNISSKIRKYIYAKKIEKKNE